MVSIVSAATPTLPGETPALVSHVRKCSDETLDRVHENDAEVRLTIAGPAENLANLRATYAQPDGVPFFASMKRHEADFRMDSAYRISGYSRSRLMSVDAVRIAAREERTFDACSL